MHEIRRSVATAFTLLAVASLLACSSKRTSTGPDLPPDPPGNVAAAGGNAVVAITWDVPADPPSYNIYWKTSSGVGTGDSRIADVTLTRTPVRRTLPRRRSTPPSRRSAR